MALAFNIKPVATLKGKSSKGDNITLPGITNSSTLTPAQAATQANKFLAIGGKNIVADKNMVRTQIEEVVDDE